MKHCCDRAGETAHEPHGTGIITRNVQHLPAIFQGIRQYSRSSEPPSGENQPFQFELLTDTELDSFEAMKRRLVSPTIWALPHFGRKNTLDTDACGHQVGCALLQEQPDRDRVTIGYWSRALTDAEKNYTTTEKECLAVVWSILTLRPCLYGNAFDLHTDHEALRWVLTMA